jgi:1-acyl-sn-glycerol-3-phosphate acyltransferase
MQQMVFEEPYQFIRPPKSRFWSHMLRKILPWYLRKTHAIVAHDVRGAEKVRASVDAGHGVVLTPSHSRLMDPMTLGLLAREAGVHFYAMAGWHAFKGSWFTSTLIRLMGAFSIFREGNDRQALDFAINNLVENDRPLVVYPEGYATRHIDVIAPLQDGIALVARRAAKQREKTGKGPLVVHPVVLYYEFLGDLDAVADPVLTMLEERLTWQPQRQLGVRERIVRLGEALVTLQELEHMGRPQSGPVAERRLRLVEHMLRPLEEEYFGRHRDEYIVTRVKNLRAAILPDMVAKRIDETERARRWRQLATVYYAQSIGAFVRDYIAPGCSPERLLEALERVAEDMTDVTPTLGPVKAIIQVADAIAVAPERVRGQRDPLMPQIHDSLQAMSSAIAAELAAKRGKQPKPSQPGPAR